MSREIILVVDDDASSCETLSDILELEGYTVLTARTGEAAEAIIRSRPVDAALLDLRLPDRSGVELLRFVKDAAPETEVLIVSGHATLDSAIEAMRYGGFGYVRKPVNVDEVLGSIRRALERQRLARELRQANAENARLYADVRKAYEQLQATQEQLLQGEKLKALGEMAAGVAHDFNNLLAVILAQAQLLGVQGADPQLQKRLRVIERAALDGAETVRRILGFARVLPDAQYVPVDLSTLLPEVLEVTRPRWKDEAQGRGAAIAAGLALEPVPPVRGNPAELREVLVNLIFNAVDAMPQGGNLTLGTRRLWRSTAPGALGPRQEILTGAGHQTQEVVEVFVRDTGVGMPEEVRRRAFDPFFTTKGVKGSGLGLSVVYGTIARHGGEVLLESQEGSGTTVTFRLPASAEAPPKVERAAGFPAARPGRIVVVDDEEVLGDLLADILRLQGHQVDIFTDPGQALEHLARESADLLFTDLGMPEMSGWDVARKARGLRPDLPVILVTGWGEQVDPARVRESRVNAVAAKPYQLAHILQVVAEVLPVTPGT